MSAAPLGGEAQAHNGAGTAEGEARDRMAPKVGTIRGRVLQMVVAAGDRGMTALETVDAYGVGRLRRYSIAPRLSELVFEGYLVDSGRTRRETTEEGVEIIGAPRQIVYIATDLGRAWAEAQS